MNIGEIIEKERKKQNISKTELAKISGCTTRSIDYWESGERKITLENADKILKALKVGFTIGHIENK